MFETDLIGIDYEEVTKLLHFLKPNSINFDVVKIDQPKDDDKNIVFIVKEKTSDEEFMMLLSAEYIQKVLERKISE